MSYADEYFGAMGDGRWGWAPDLPPDGPRHIPQSTEVVHEQIVRALAGAVRRAGHVTPNVDLAGPAAHHEAGHAVASWALAVPISTVTIDARSGHGVTTRATATALPAEFVVAIAAAGGIAERERFGSSLGDGSDEERIDALLANGWASEEQVRAGRELAQGLVDKYASVVVTVARRLAERGRLTGTDLAYLVHPWRPAVESDDAAEELRGGALDTRRPCNSGHDGG